MLLVDNGAIWQFGAALSRNTSSVVGRQREVSHAHSTSKGHRRDGRNPVGAPVFQTAAGDGRAGGAGTLREASCDALHVSRGTENAVGRTRSTGHLDGRIGHAFAAF